MRFRFLPTLGLAAALLLSGCRGGSQYPREASGLRLEKAVLYRNGVGYFDHVGFVKDGTLRLRVPRQHLNDILKSLTVVDPHGQVLRVSMPLDAAAFEHQDAFSRDTLHGTLRALRGTPVELVLDDGSLSRISGRIFQVESMMTPEALLDREDRGPLVEDKLDYRVSLVADRGIVTAKLSEILEIHILDKGIRLSLERALDSSAGTGSLQLVDVDIVLSNEGSREVSVSYVVEAPVWKPTYRVVIPGDGKNQVLLQGWAVVHNMSGDDWNDVQLSLAAGAPIAFRYDMHRPSRVERQDLSWMERQQNAEVAVGDASVDEAMMEAGEEVEQEAMEDEAMADEVEAKEMSMGGVNKSRAPMPSKRRLKKAAARPPKAPPHPPMPDFANSVPATRESSRASGLTKITLGRRLSIPQGRSSMLAFVNERVPGEAALLYKPGGAGPGYANHPYRVLRFRNQTPLLLESGPISLYAGGTFVGEGIADPIGSGAWATIPYAVETSVNVVSDVVQEQSPLRVVRISSGVLEVEQFSQFKRTWRVQGPAKSKVHSVFIDQVRSGPRYELVSPSPDSAGVEVFPDYYRLKLEIPAGEQRASLDVVEKTPSSFSLSIWDSRALELLETVLSVQGASAETKRSLEPIIKLRRELGSIDTKLRALSEQREDLEFHADQIRRNLKAIAKDKAAKQLRRQLSDQLMERSKKIDAVGREIVELRSRRLNQRLELERMLQKVDLRFAPQRGAPPREVVPDQPPTQPKAQAVPEQPPKASLRAPKQK